MMDPSEARLSDPDRWVVRETVEELGAAWPPSSRRPLGWLAAFLGLGLLVGWPRVEGQLPGGDFVSPFVLLTGWLLVLGGPVLALLGGAGRERAARAAVEAALRRLEDPGADRETVLRAATLLVLHGWVGTPPSPGEDASSSTSGSSPTVDSPSAAGSSPAPGSSAARTFAPEEVRSRIGDRLRLVKAVEDHLVARHGAHPVFTEEGGEPTEGDVGESDGAPGAAGEKEPEDRS